MSQNKTIIPDFEIDNGNQMYANNISTNSEFYMPSGSQVNSTVISGMTSENSFPQSQSTGERNQVRKEDNSQFRTIHVQDRVIVGVLFSVSKDLLGEIFPIYLGRNMIGSNESCDVRLREKTVSYEHAVLYVRSEGYPAECLMTISDYGSMHGSMVNQKDSRYETLSLRDGDLLTIGRHYKLVVKLFNIKEYGLSEDNGFEENETVTDIDLPPSQPVVSDLYAPSATGNNDIRTVIG